MISIQSVSMYAIYDNAAEEYGPPFIAKTDAVANRMFSSLFEREGATSADYVLYRIGMYDPATATLGSIKPVKIDVVEKIKDVFGEKNVVEVK